MPNRLSRAVLRLFPAPNKRVHHSILACLLAVTLAAAGHRVGHAAEMPSISGLLDRYRSGAFDSAVEPLANVGDPLTFRASFVQAADAWIAGEPTDRPNRRLVAAAFAIEVAHVRLFYDVVSLHLVDWAAQEMWKGPPSPAERAWILAGVAVLRRGSHGFNFASGSPKNWKGYIGGAAIIDRAMERFPDEPRFRLDQVLWNPNVWRNRRARGDLERLVKDPAVGAEALVQLAYLKLTEREFQDAIRLAHQATEGALEPSTTYLAHFIAAFCHEAERRPADAVREYAAALRAVPNGQSASIALALLLMRDNQAEAAFDVVDRSLAADPRGDDPWRLFAYGGYVRWPLLRAEGRKFIH